MDNLIKEINTGSRAEKIWTVYKHHLHVAVIYIAHNIFQKVPPAKTIIFNTDYYIIFKQNRDLLKVQRFSIQTFSNKSQGFMDTYHKATSSIPFGYLIVDLSIFSDLRFRLRTRIFPNEDTVVYNLCENMKDFLKKESLIVHYLLKLKEGEAKTILKSATKSHIAVICRIVLKRIKRSFDFKPSEVKTLKPCNTSLFFIANKNTGLNRKRKLLATRYKQVLLILNAAKKWLPLEE